MKKCKYCCGEIPEKATVCMHCHRRLNLDIIVRYIIFSLLFIMLFNVIIMSLFLNK